MSFATTLKARLVVALFLATQIDAQDVHWRLAKRLTGYTNDTIASSNATFSPAGTSSTPSSRIETETSQLEIQTTSPVSTTPSNQPTTIVSPSTNSPSSGDGSDRPTSLPSSGPGNADGGSCGSTVTYHGSVYPTVYVTITESFGVTLSSPNASMTESETLITPEQACGSTVVPIADGGRFTIEATILETLTSTTEPPTSSFSTLGPFTNGTRAGTASTSFQDAPASSAPGNINGPGRPHPGAQPEAPEDDNGLHVTPKPVQTTVQSDVPYTSTVIVTKKTPVPVLPASQIESPPVFQPVDPSQQQRPPNPQAPAPNPSNGNGPANDPVTNPSGGGSDNPNQQRPQPGGNGPNRDPPQVEPQTTIADVPVAVRPSSIIIGTSAIAIPVAGAEIAVTQNGVEFIVRPSEIAAPSTTIGFRPLSLQQANVISVPPTRVTAAPGVVVEVAGSTAIVAGTTYRINEDFSTIITVSGQRISIGPSGVGLPSTTIMPAVVTNGATISNVGSITFTISGSDVFISGTHFGIATDSPSITTSFSGEQVSIGPGGIGFASTTVVPGATKGSSSSASRTGSSSPSNTGEPEAPGADSAASVHGVSLITLLLVSAISLILLS